LVIYFYKKEGFLIVLWNIIINDENRKMIQKFEGELIKKH